MKNLSIILLFVFSGTLIAQNSPDEILASHNINQGKEKHTLLASEFNKQVPEQLDGIYKLLSDNGSIKEVRSFKTGELDGTWLEYDNKGTLIAIANYKNNKKHGEWVIWDAKGTKRYELHYENGIRTDVWKSWDEAGVLISEKEY